MRKWFAIAILLGALFISLPARAQSQLAFSSLQVQLWPEYDQPSMLVIYDFEVPPATPLPVGITLRIPKEANLIAVASQAPDGSLLNADYQGPTAADNWQSIAIQIRTSAAYRIEYYQPLARDGDVRGFSFLWPGDYAVDQLALSVRLPIDATNVTSDPPMQSSQGSDGTPYLTRDFGAWSADRQLQLQLTYTKKSDTLTASKQSLEPSQPIGGATQGRVMLSNYLPYVVGLLGLALIVGGSVYFLQSTRARGMVRQPRHRRAAEREGRSSTEVYCHQCGTRAQEGDRFCRVCGTRLRQPD